MVRVERVRKAKPSRIVAYDFETTRIEPGTPRPLYLTAFAPTFHCAGAIRSMEHLRKIIIGKFLTPDEAKTKYVAWNGNRFDAYFVAAALIPDPTYMLVPYMTRSKSLRGLRVVKVLDDNGAPLDEKSAPSWEFLDGIAMLGLAGMNLETFLKSFAPEHHKLTGVIDFEKEEFDPDNKQHRDYAMRDSVGLWHGMHRAQTIMIDTFNQPLTVTMGGVCIKIFQAHIPKETTVQALIPDVEQIVRTFVLRGGYCHCARRYAGPIWKYDINQAYAAAMRESKLPSGYAINVKGKPLPKAQCFIAYITAVNKNNKVPFYYRTQASGRTKSVFSDTNINLTWVTSIEYRQLEAEGWHIHCVEYWLWSDSFDMREYVDKLEVLRINCEGGPKGPIGTMVKATGNHSFGKTLEALEPIDFVLASECPDGYLPFYGDDVVPVEHVFYKMTLDRKPKAYHQPHIGSFITSHARMVLRRAILLNPDAWLYADTDCIVFSEDMTNRLDISPTRYGAWKIEEEGTPYRIIAKKVYAEIDGKEKSAKGMNVKKLTDADFAKWFDGDLPVQNQIQSNNFLAVLCGAEMYRSQLRTGTAIG